MCYGCLVVNLIRAFIVIFLRGGVGGLLLLFQAFPEAAAQVGEVAVRSGTDPERLRDKKRFNYHLSAQVYQEVLQLLIQQVPHKLFIPFGRFRVS